MLTLKYILRLLKLRFPMNEEYGFLVDNQGNDPLGLHAGRNPELPSLLDHLFDAYTAHIKAQMESIKRLGKRTQYRTANEAAAKAPTDNFLAFAERYLNENRPTNQFHVDENVGIVLRNHVRVCIAPNTNAAGSMQDSGAVPVMTGESQPKLGGTAPGNAVEIGG